MQTFKATKDWKTDKNNNILNYPLENRFVIRMITSVGFIPENNKNIKSKI